MIVQTDHGKYKVRFKYIDGAYPDNPTNNAIITKTTLACISLLGNGIEESHGYAFCSHLDRFNRETGRKVALTRALQSLPREIRKKFWEAYFNRTAPKIVDTFEDRLA